MNYLLLFISVWGEAHRQDLTDIGSIDANSLLCGDSRRSTGRGRGECWSGAGMSEMDLKYSPNSMERCIVDNELALDCVVNGSVITVYRPGAAAAAAREQSQLRHHLAACTLDLVSQPRTAVTEVRCANPRRNLGEVLSTILINLKATKTRVGLRLARALRHLWSPGPFKLP